MTLENGEWTDVERVRFSRKGPQVVGGFTVVSPVYDLEEERMSQREELLTCLRPTFGILKEADECEGDGA